MTRRFFTAIRWLLVMGAGATVAPACVRMDPPTTFTCNTREDCAQDEMCRSSICVPEGYCTGDYECGLLKVCEDKRCVAIECDPGHLQNCQPGYRCEDNRCLAACGGDNDCLADHHCEDGRCADGAPRYPNGSYCTEATECESGICCEHTSGGRTCSERCDEAGAVCANHQDCKSYVCCEQPSGDRVCSSTACLPIDCRSDRDCSSEGFCDAQKHCARLLEDGSRCSTDRQCLHGQCLSDTCRGAGALGDACQEDYNCGSQRKCCNVDATSRECVALSAPCLGDIGDACVYDSQCLDGHCEDSWFCSKPCSAHADCGNGPFGAPNVCTESVFGDKICFAGCNTEEQCASEFNGNITCYLEAQPSFCDTW